MNIDITKKYTTRDGREVVIFEVSDKVYCKVRERGEWLSTSRHLNGRLFMTAENGSDLRSVKAWRAWKVGEAPKFFMVRSQDKGLMLGLDRSKIDCFNALFIAFDWLHEDGTTTPCGVRE